MTEAELEEMKRLQDEVAKLQEELANAKTTQDAGEQSTALTVLDTIDKTTTDVDLKVETLCRWAAARAGAIVIAPLLGTVALMANEVYLVSRIAREYDVKLTERAVLAFLGAMGSRMAGNFLTTLIPFSAIQVPVAVGITYSLGRVTQRWLKDGMPTDMAPYADMMSEWKDKAREQVDRLRANPLKNIPLGDETVDYMKKWGNAAKDVVMEVKEKGQEAIQHVRHRDTLVEDVAAEKEQAAAATAEKEEAEKAVAAEEKSVEEQVRAAVEDAKIPLDE